MPTLAAAITRQAVPIADSLDITNSFDVEAVSAFDLLFAGAALVGGFILSRMAKRALLRFFRSVDAVPDDTGRLVARITGYLVFLIGLFVAIESLGFSWGPLGSLLLLALIVLFFTARPLLEDLGAGLLLQIRQPFTHGDLVNVAGELGVVDKIDSRTVVLQTIDGRRVHLPSRSVLSSAIVNLTVERERLTTFVAGVEYSTDLDRARSIAVDAMAGAQGVRADPPPEALVEEFADSTINISCRFWHDPDLMSELRVRDAAMRAVKRAFDANGIVIAFPQRVLWRTGENA